MLEAIKADPTLIERFWAKVNKLGPNDCWEWSAKSVDKGYGQIVTSRKTGRCNVLATRLSYYLEYGIWPDKLFVCHKCDNPPCVNPNHLFLGTHMDNMQDMIGKGRHKTGDQKGEANGYAKLTKDNVIEIKRLILSGLNNIEIAAIYGVTHSNVSLIRLGKTWKNI